MCILAIFLFPINFPLGWHVGRKYDPGLMKLACWGVHSNSREAVCKNKSSSTKCYKGVLVVDPFRKQWQPNKCINCQECNQQRTNARVICNVLKGICIWSSFIPPLCNPSHFFKLLINPHSYAFWHLLFQKKSPVTISQLPGSISAHNIC